MDWILPYGLQLGSLRKSIVCATGRARDATASQKSKQDGPDPFSLIAGSHQMERKPQQASSEVVSQDFKPTSKRCVLSGHIVVCLSQKIKNKIPL